MHDALPADFAALPQLIDYQATHRGEHRALQMGDEQRSYQELQARITQVAQMLRGIAEPGARVGVLSWNSIAFVELLYAVPAAGMILVPLNARLAPDEWQYQLAQSGTTLVFAQDTFMDALSTLQAPEALTLVNLDTDYEQRLQAAPTSSLPTLHGDEPAWLLYTSGSTGRPKGAVLTHRSLLAGLVSASHGRPVEPSDVYFYPFPLFHVAAHNVLLQHAFGACVLLSAAFDAQTTLAACRNEGVTTLSLAPTMIAMLLDHPHFQPTDLQDVRTIGYGASAMPLTLLERLQSVSSVGLCQSYGMTELCGSISFLTVEDHHNALRRDEHLLKSVGTPLPTAEVKIVDDSGQTLPDGMAGEIIVRADQCFSHYWDDVDATAKALVDGWLHTGDVGLFDERGYLFIVDRKKDMIITGGENVASREVEEVLRRHPAVRECAIIGLPDKQWGEALTAVVSLSEPVTDAALQAHCREALAGYKTPRAWLRVETLPVNAGGKIDKPLLRRQFAPPSGR